ncbi:MAG: response regulator transcription factor [Firmicutes bacterium]|nr:response regulator transcription factor [Bacillota bacterium]
MAYKVLIVDDEYLIRQGLSEGIPWSEIGFEVSGTAANGREALAHIRETVPNVIITDVKMPVIDGIELSRIVKQEYPDIKTIILSGYGEFEYAQKAIEYNVCSYILKPLNEEDLIKLFKNIYNELEIQSKIKSKMKESGSASGNFFNGRRDEIIDYVFMKLISRDFEEEGQYEKDLMSVGFNTRNKYFYIAAFNCSNISKNNGKKISSEELFQLSSKYCKQLGYQVLYLNRVFYVVAHCENKILRRDQEYFAMGIKNHIENTLNSEYNGNYVISIGIGRVCKELLNLRDSANEAGIALNYKYYSGEGNIIFYDEIRLNQNVSINKSQIEAVTKELIAGILNDNDGLLVPLLKKLFLHISSLNLLDINKLCIKCTQIYLSIVEEIKKEYIFITALTEEEFFNRIAKYETFKDMTEEFKWVVLDLKKQIKYYNQTSDRHQFILKIKKHINENYHNNLTLDKLSRDFFINPSYLSKIFKDETGENLSDYILGVRMKNAERLLKTSNAKIQEVSKQVGYEDYRYFCTVFKKVMGVTPLQYRIKST